MENQNSDIINVHLTPKQHGFVLASLRMTQAALDGMPIEHKVEHFELFCGEKLSSEEIDSLCEQINGEEQPPLSFRGEFDVNVFAVVRIKVPGVKAESMEKASEMAKDEVITNCLSRLTAPGQYTVEFADEFSRTVVDVVGDIDYSKSQEFTD